jgi:hypothetical protein
MHKRLHSLTSFPISFFNFIQYPIRLLILTLPLRFLGLELLHVPVDSLSFFNLQLLLIGLDLLSYLVELLFVLLELSLHLNHLLPLTYFGLDFQDLALVGELGHLFGRGDFFGFDR